MVTLYISEVTAKGNSSYSYFSQEYADMNARGLDQFGCTNCMGCLGCNDCSNCTDCRYCADCEDCISCKYCDECTGCARCESLFNAYYTIEPITIA